jgi:putative ABC transport system permease protein
VSHDLSSALRFFRRTPLLSSIAVLTLALGIGVSTAVFATVYTVSLKPLPFPTLSRLVEVRTRSGTRSVVESPYLSRSALDDIVGQSGSLEQVGQYMRASVTLSGRGEPEVLDGLIVSGGFFSCYGVLPSFGRFVQAADEREDSPTVVVISHALWQRAFNAMPWSDLEPLSMELAVLPATTFTPFTIKGKPYRIVGVMPPKTTFPVQADVFVVLGSRSYRVAMGVDPRSIRNTAAIALRKTGTSLADTNAELAVIGARMAAEHPDTDKGWDVVAVPMRGVAAENYSTTLFLLLAAVHCVLLLACVSVSSLFVARTRSRETEFAVRQSLGATVPMLMRQVVAETGLTTLAGALVGVFVAWLGVHLLAWAAPPSLRAFDDIRLDWVVLGYTVAMSMAAGLMISLTPRSHLARLSLVESLKSRIPRPTVITGFPPVKTRGFLVCLQIALSVPLVVAAFLTIRSLGNLVRVDTGYEGSHIVVLQAKLSTVTCGKHLACLSTISQIVTQLRSVPGVSNAAMTATRPLSTAFAVPVLTEGVTVSDASGLQALLHMVTPGFFETMGIPLLAGRTFVDADRQQAPRVAIVNRAFALKRLGDRPVGKRVSLEQAGMSGWVEVVGEVGDTRDISLKREPSPALYIPIEQFRAIPRTVFIVSAAGSPEELIAPLRRRLLEFDHNAVITDVRSAQELKSAEMAGPKFDATVLGFFGATAILLAVLGCYCLATNEVAERFREMGIRLALGAERRAILLMILREGARPIVVGLVIGAAVSMAVAHLLQHLVFGLSPYDPLTLAAVVVALATVGLLAHYLPARYASRIDPLQVLRWE